MEKLLEETAKVEREFATLNEDSIARTQRMKWRLEIIGTIEPSAAYAAWFAVGLVDDSIRIPTGPAIALGLVCVAMVVVGVVQRKDWRPLRKVGELIALCIVMALLFVPVLFVFGIISLMMFGVSLD